MSPATERHRVLRIGAAMLLLGLAGGFVGGMRWTDPRPRRLRRGGVAMTRFVDLGTQLDVDDEGPRSFAWYDTITDRFRSWNGSQTWTSWADFEKDYDGHDLERFRRLFPKAVSR